jgi:hypothetical protein
MRLKILGGILVAVVALGLMANANANAAVSPPQPISPAEGALAEVDEVDGVTLTVSAPTGTFQRTYIEASQNPATTIAGDFVDPLAVTVATLATHDPNVLIAYLDRTNFANPVAFEGETGRVYWHPFVHECEFSESETICTHFGVMRSFLYDVRPKTAPPPPATAGPTPCQLAKRKQRRVRTGVNVAQRRYAGARTIRQRRLWRARWITGKRLLRRAERRTRRTCQ